MSLLESDSDASDLDESIVNQNLTIVITHAEITTIDSNEPNGYNFDSDDSNSPTSLMAALYMCMLADLVKLLSREPKTNSNTLTSF